MSIHNFSNKKCVTFLFYLMRDIIVNLYQLHFSSSHFSSQPNKLVFNLSTFPSSQSNTNERKLKSLLSFHFSILFSFFIFLLFHSSIQMDIQDIFGWGENKEDGKYREENIVKNGIFLYLVEKRKQERQKIARKIFPPSPPFFFPPNLRGK